MACAEHVQRFKNWLDHAGLDEKQHQLNGIQWVFEKELSDSQAPGGFLCDEMGLGKTILMLGAIICNLKKRTLVVMPNSLLPQWEGAIQKFLGVSPLDFHGEEAKNTTIDELSKRPIVITTSSIPLSRVLPQPSSHPHGGRFGI